MTAINLPTGMFGDMLFAIQVVKYFETLTGLILGRVLWQISVFHDFGQISLP